MLESVGKLNYAIVLCDDIDRMKAFYREFFPFPVVSETETSLALGAGHVLLALRKRERSYDGPRRRCRVAWCTASLSRVARRSRRVLPTAG